jgi:hypothetical protein
MAVRMPGGEIRSVPRRVGLAMVARSRATHAPAQSAPPVAVKGRRSASAVTVVTAEAPELAPPVQSRGPAADAVVVDERTPAVTPQTSGVVDLADHDPAGAPVEFEEDDPTALRIEPPAGERPKGNAGREAWADYARAYGMTITDAMSRNYIRDTVVSMLETDRMSRPAHEGGRPATPEDEPVTEDMVTSADPGERTA